MLDANPNGNANAAGAMVVGEEQENENGESVRGLAADGGTVLSASAIVTEVGASSTHTIGVHERLEGTTLRVLFDGRFLPSQTRSTGSLEPPSSGWNGNEATSGASGASSRGCSGAAGADESIRDARGGGEGGGVAGSVARGWGGEVEGNTGGGGGQWLERGEGGGGTGAAGRTAGGSSGVGEPAQTNTEPRQHQKTELVIYTPSQPEDPSHVSASAPRNHEALTGLAWVVTVLEKKTNKPTALRCPDPLPSWATTVPPPSPRAAAREPSQESEPTPTHNPTNDARYEMQQADSGDSGDSGGSLACPPFVRVGGSVPLLLIPDAGVVAEVNSAAAHLRSTMGACKANAFIARLGNCITISTVNTDDFVFVFEVLQVFNMTLTKKFLLASYFVTGGRAPGGPGRRRDDEDEVSVATATRGNGARAWDDREDDGEEEDGEEFEKGEEVRPTEAARSGGATEEEVISRHERGVIHDGEKIFSTWPSFSCDWRFLPACVELGGSSWRRTTAVVSRRCRALTHFIQFGRASCNPAAEDEIERLLRMNPSLGTAWSSLTVMLGKSLWPIICAPLIVHWLKTRHECGVPFHAMMTLSVCQVAASIILLAYHVRYGSSCLDMDYRLNYPRYTAVAFITTAFGCFGYGYGISYIPVMSENYGDTCSNARITFMLLLCVLCTLIFCSLNIHLRRCVFGLHANCVFWLALPFAAHHVTGRSPYNHFATWRLSKWQPVHDAVRSASRAQNTSSGVEEPAEKAALEAFFFWMDVAASTVRTAIIFIFIPRVVSRRTQSAFATSLAAPPTVETKNNNNKHPENMSMETVGGGSSAVDNVDAGGAATPRRRREDIFLDFFNKVKKRV